MLCMCVPCILGYCCLFRHLQNGFDEACISRKRVKECESMFVVQCLFFVLLRWKRKHETMEQCSLFVSIAVHFQARNLQVFAARSQVAHAPGTHAVALSANSSVHVPWSVSTIQIQTPQAERPVVFILSTCHDGNWISPSVILKPKLTKVPKVPFDVHVTSDKIQTRTLSTVHDTQK